MLNHQWPSVDNNLQLIITSKLLASALKIFIHAWFASCMSAEDDICHQQKKTFGGGAKYLPLPKEKSKFSHTGKKLKWNYWVLDIKWTDGDVFLFHLSALISQYSLSLEYNIIHYITTQTILAFWIGLDHNFFNPGLWYDTLL